MGWIVVGPSTVEGSEVKTTQSDDAASIGEAGWASDGVGSA